MAVQHADAPDTIFLLSMSNKWDRSRAAQ